MKLNISYKEKVKREKGESEAGGVRSEKVKSRKGRK